ncbi:MAG: LPS-assembly protein LptD [Bacteroidales bacterium]|nr:LPS-assembly protein LptD [Bacteroidales bacterium]
MADSARLNLSKIDSLQNNTTDSVNINTQVKQKPNQIDAEINYTAKDSIVFLGNGTGFLHGESDVKYKNINLKADFVRVSMDSSLLFARGNTDSLGTKIGEPVFSENEKSYSSRELTYNLRSKKGYIRQVVTQEGEGYIISERTKKTPDDVFCMTGGKYTTCDNHDHPDFYLSLSKGKVKPGEYIVTGPAHLVIADVPLPIAIPFGFFPFTSQYSSGVLMPNYADELTRGFGLTNGGYYFAINDYADLEVRGDVYTKGTWAIRGTSTYLKRYKFRGTLGIEYRVDVTGEEGMSNYNKLKSFKVSWSHSQDQKANPNFAFSSSVNFSTSGFNKNNINYYSQPEKNSENTKYSSINITKRFPSIPSLSLSGSMSITQRTKDSTLSVSLPTLNISYSRFYPFKRKAAVGKERWYEKISMSYTGALSNSIDNINEKLILHSSLQRDWRNGMKHNIPVSATFNILKYINVSPTFNYTERWYLRSINKSWDKDRQIDVTDTVSKFSRVYDFNMGVSASTKLYGFYKPVSFLFGNKIDRIRHVLTPSIGFGYTPDFGDPRWGYYDTYTKSVKDASNPNVYHDNEVQYSHYQGSLYGVPGTGKSGSINFSLGNNVEMKVRNDKDTTGTNPFKKISLIDNFSISGNYNLAVDSMRWSVFSTTLRIKITDSYSLSLSAGFDPYMYGLNSNGDPVRINKLRWENGGFPRFQGTSTSYSYTISNDTFKKLFGKKEGMGNTGQPSASGNANEQGQANPGSSAGNQKAEAGDDGYQKVTIPWSISINYSVQYMPKMDDFDFDKMEYNMAFTHNLSLNGNLSLTNNWKISANSTYDFKYKKFTYTSINVNRSLHCWSMSGSIVPFGVYKSYSFHIGVNASMLADLKYDKQSEPSSNAINWY